MYIQHKQNTVKLLINPTGDRFENLPNTPKIYYYKWQISDGNNYCNRGEMLTEIVGTVV